MRRTSAALILLPVALPVALLLTGCADLTIDKQSLLAPTLHRSRSSGSSRGSGRRSPPCPT